MDRPCSVCRPQPAIVALVKLDGKAAAAGGDADLAPQGARMSAPGADKQCFRASANHTDAAGSKTEPDEI